MRVRPLPKSWLIHTVIYEEFTGNKDDFSNPVYKPPATIRNVRYDNSTVFSRDNTQTKIQAEGIIFVDSVNSSPILKFKEQSKVRFEGRELTIKKVVPCYYPNRSEVHHYEIEVV